MEPIIKIDPETEKIKQENLAARQNGFSRKGVYEMFKAAAILAVKDYAKCYKMIKRAEELGLNYNTLKYVDSRHPADVMKECREYFKTRNFRQVFGVTDQKALLERIKVYGDVLDKLDEFDDEKEREQYMYGIIDGTIKV